MGFYKPSAFLQNRSFKDWDVYPNMTSDPPELHGYLGKVELFVFWAETAYQAETACQEKIMAKKLRIKAKCHKFKFAKCREAAVKVLRVIFVGFLSEKNNTSTLLWLGFCRSSQHGKNRQGCIQGQLGAHKPALYANGSCIFDPEQLGNDIKLLWWKLREIMCGFSGFL